MKLIATPSEMSIIRTICGKNKAYAGKILSSVTEDYFHNEFTKTTYSRILQVNKEKGEIPTWREVLDDPGLDEEIRKKLKTSNVERITDKSEVDSTLHTLNEYRQLRGVFDLIDEASNSLRKSKVRAAPLLKEMAEKLVELQQTKAMEQVVLSFGVDNNATQMVKDFLGPETKENYLPTGFPEFDEENGGITNGSLFVLGGSTGAGKSALASQLAINWTLMGERVVIVPLEMAEREMAARILANAADMDVRKILFHRMSKEEKIKFQKGYKRFVLERKKSGGSYKIFKPPYDMTIEEIMSSVYPLDARVIIVDYISLLKDVDGDDAWQKLGQVTRYCKMYAEAHNKIVVMLCQINEEGMVRYAKKILEDASYAWLFVATKQTRESEVMNIDQKKARNGRLFDFVLKAKLDVMQIRSMEPEELQDMKHESKTEKKKGYKGQQAQKDKPKVKQDANYLADIADED